MTKRKLSVLTLTLIGALTLAALAGILPAGTPSLTGVTGVEANDHESQLHSGESVSNQQAIYDAIAAHGADKWHEAGFTGAGVKVGIIDFGFQDLPTHPLSTDIDGQLCFEPRTLGGTPSAVSSEDLAVCQRASPLTPAGHGTLSVEAVHLFAPDAEVYITNPTEPIQIPAAIDWLIDQDVDVVIRTHGWSWEGAGDGKPFDGLSEHLFFRNRVADIYSQLDKATEAGILWAQGMGNAANITWTGAFSDPDGDGWHNFSGTDECNDVDLKAYPQIFYPWLRWDGEVGNASAIRDLDIYLLGRSGDVDLPDLTQLSDADRATFNQSSFPDLLSVQSSGASTGKVDQSTVPFPLEVTTAYGVRAEGTYCLAVNNVSETKDARPAGPDWMQMQLWQAPEGENTVEYKTPEQPSVITPADSANEGLIAVAGASAPDTLLAGSGRGPTRDGRTKPDIVVSEIDFADGHIEAAAVAGALAALVKDRYENITPARIAKYLRMHALDYGDPGPDNSWGHGFAVLPDDTDPKAAAKAFVEEAIAAYSADPDAAKTYYQSEASVDRNTDLYLFIIDDKTITVNAGFPGAVGQDITSRIGIDAIGKEYGEEIAAADDKGTFVDYLIPDPLHDYTLYRKHTWAIKADNGLIFAAGAWDKTEEVESALEPHEDVVAAIYKAGARLLAFGGDLSAFDRLIAYYKTPGSIVGERYVFLVDPDGIIAADATMPDLVGTNIRSLQADDNPNLGQEIAAVQEGESLWFSHMWPNPATGQEERKYTYVTKFQGIIFGSGYYGAAPPPDLQDPCFTTIDGSGRYTGKWDDSITCLSENRPDGVGGDSGSDYYARFFTITLDESTSVTINLTSDADTFLYLMEGSDKDGAIEAENDDISTPDNLNSRIEDQMLREGTYTIEATTYDAEAPGNFTLVVEIEEVDEPPTPEPGMTFIAISSGANHVCAISEDGSIMCWGDNDYGQVSDRPTSGSFTQISSGDNHTCALRNDGAVICWGSVTVP